MRYHLLCISIWLFLQGNSQDDKTRFEKDVFDPAFEQSVTNSADQPKPPKTIRIFLPDWYFQPLSANESIGISDPEALDSADAVEQAVQRALILLSLRKEVRLSMVADHYEKLANGKSIKTGFYEFGVIFGRIPDVGSIEISQVQQLESGEFLVRIRKLPQYGIRSTFFKWTFMNQIYEQEFSRFIQLRMDLEYGEDHDRIYHIRKVDAVNGFQQSFEGEDEYIYYDEEEGSIRLDGGLWKQICRSFLFKLVLQQYQQSDRKVKSIDQWYLSNFEQLTRQVTSSGITMKWDEMPFEDR